MSPVPAMLAPRLSLSLASLSPASAGAPWGATPRDAIEWTRTLGYAGVQLDATMPGVRPRELDRSARRDLAAVLRRTGLVLSGLDVFVPPAHLLPGASTDRAVSAVVQAIELASDLRAMQAAPTGQEATVTLELPREPAPGVLSELTLAGDRWGVRIADSAWPPRVQAERSTPTTPAASDAGATHAQSGLSGVCLDPGAMILAGERNVPAAAARAARVIACRLSDASGAGRVPAGEGGLDVLAYAMTLGVLGLGWCAVDVRGLASPAPVAARLAQHAAFTR